MMSATSCFVQYLCSENRLELENEVQSIQINGLPINN